MHSSAHRRIIHVSTHGIISVGAHSTVNRVREVTWVACARPRVSFATRLNEAYVPYVSNSGWGFASMYDPRSDIVAKRRLCDSRESDSQPINMHIWRGTIRWSRSYEIPMYTGFRPTLPAVTTHILGQLCTAAAQAAHAIRVRAPSGLQCGQGTLRAHGELQCDATANVILRKHTNDRQGGDA